MSTFGAAFDLLPRDIRRGIIQQLRIRRFRYELAMRGQYLDTQLIVLGDKPGPGRPTQEGYHHTPFYSTKNSSLYVNRLLVEGAISDNDLTWFNTELANGSPLDPKHVQALNAPILCLGNLAEMWVRKYASTSRYVKIPHPAYAKRFHAGESYPIVDEIRRLTCPAPAAQIAS